MSSRRALISRHCIDHRQQQLMLIPCMHVMQMIDTPPISSEKRREEKRREEKRREGIDY
jgi:hypothetical protein